MLSKKHLINRLEFYYKYIPRDVGMMLCPFGKHNPLLDADWARKVEENPRRIPCSELCGRFPELGDVNRGCPCNTLGEDVAWLQLGRIIERYRRQKKSD